MLFSTAFAQSATASAAPSIFELLVPVLVALVIMYLLIFRPQQKKNQQHQKLVSSLSRGDVVITQGGIVGKVTKLINDNEVEVEISQETRVRVYRKLILGLAETSAASGNVSETNKSVSKPKK